jgi:hypothetical protein
MGPDYGGGVMVRIGVAAVLAVAFAVAPGSAQAQATNPPCTITDISASDGLSVPTPVADRPGNRVVVRTVLHNTTGASFRNLNFILAVIPPSQTEGNAPSLAWRLDGGPWHGFGVTWQAPSGSAPDWQSGIVYTGDLAAGQTRTLELSASFSSGSKTGQYQDSLAFSADPCGMQALALTELFYGYFLSAPASQPSASSPEKAPTGTNKQNVAPPAPPRSTTPSSAPPSAASPAPSSASPAPSSASPAPSSAASSPARPPSSPPTASRLSSRPPITEVAAAKPNMTLLALTSAILASFAALGLPIAFAVKRQLRRRTHSD